MDAGSDAACWVLCVSACQVPDDELASIVERRCQVAPSHAAALVNVQRELVLRRTASNCFAGKHGFITPRDLFRWAERGAISYQDLAENGFLILGERLRDPQVPLQDCGCGNVLPLPRHCACTSTPGTLFLGVVPPPSAMQVQADKSEH